MFSTSQYLGSRKPPTNTYRDVGASTALDGASPHKLVSMIYSALSSQLASARGAMARGDVPEKGRAISHAVRIVEEGLRTPLDLRNGGELAANLNDLYDYMVRQLTLANLRNDDAPIAECMRLVETLREGWEGIAQQVQVAPRIAA